MEKQDKEDTKSDMMSQIIIAQLRKTIAKMRGEYDSMVQQRELLQEFGKAKYGYEHENKLVKDNEYKGNEKYPTKLLHGKNRLAPYFLGECCWPGCNEPAVFVCHFEGDDKSIATCFGARYTSCKGAYCAVHAPGYLLSNWRCCQKTKYYYVRCCKDCIVANRNRIYCARTCFITTLWLSVMVPLIVIFGVLTTGL